MKHHVEKVSEPFEEKPEKSPFEVVNLDNDRDASAARLHELKAGRNEDSIPLRDEYWVALNKHRLAHALGHFDKKGK